jgi:perosamine synthetase
MANITYEIYKKSVRDTFYFLKNSKNIKDAYLKAIPIENSGFLLPVSQYHSEDEALLESLARWRNDNVEVYPTQFQATIESTRSWILNKLINVEDRILFLVVDAKGSVVGHMGFNGCHNEKLLFEIDNVVRGSQSAEKGLFSKAMHSLIEWARKTMNVEGFFLRVMDDNPHAIGFYKKNNFVENQKIPLAKEINGNTVSYREAGSDEKSIKCFVYMEFKPSAEKIGESLILTAGPSVSAKEGFYSYDAALKGWNSEWSKYLSKFERNFADYVGVKYAMATSSCTGALQIGLMALDIGPGDEVIVPDQTWVATANAVRYVGAIPIFADIEVDTWNLDVKSVEGLITNKTKAIMPVHMYGHPARMDALVALANKYNLKIVEDAAPAIGAEWQGKRCGSFGDFAGFSFQGAKLMVTGEGGMLVTNNDDLYKKALKIWDQGRNPTKVFWIDEDGVKFKMSNVQAAIGLAQLERVDELIEMKRRIFSWYEEILHDVPFITLNKEINEARSIYWMSSIRLDLDAPLSRDELMKILKSRNIDSRPVFPAISQYPIWPKQQSPQPIASLVGNQAINLPSGVCLSKDEVMYVARNIKELLSK